ncbi:MAG TPA: TonB-dependent receptor [Chthoniobacterales bacterium]
MRPTTSPRLIRTAAFSGLLAAAGLASSAAQEVNASATSGNNNQTGQAPSVTQGGELQRVTVTGYLIPRIGDGPEPVETLDQDFIGKQANQTINDVLNRVPSGISVQNQLTFAGNSNSPASSAFGLRGLPANATLILVDGFRFPNYPFPINSTETFVDLNSIPLAAVDRIEILKDGGSATYGSDAVAGVVNLITKDGYNGADIFNYYGISQRGDFETYHGSLTAGVSTKLLGGNFNIVTTFDYYDQSPILSVNRWYAYGDRSKLSPNYPDQPVAFFPARGNYTGNTTNNTYQVRPGVVGPNITANDFEVNGNPANTFIPIDEELAAHEYRWGGTFNVNYSPTDYLKFYDKFIIQRVEEKSETPNQGFSAGDNITIPANNPYNPFGEDLTPNGQLLREFGTWQTDVISRTFRNIVGATVQLPHDWFIDASFLYGESDATQTVYNSENKANLQAALNGTLPGYEGQFFNPFTDENVSGHPNQQFYNAIRTQQLEDSRTSLLQATLRLGGTVYELPSGPITIAGGVEYRAEELINSNDINSRNNNITSADFQGKLLSARRYIKSAYGELDFPILGDKWSWPGARALDVVFSYRYDDYSTFGEAAKPKVALRYKPFDDLTFRATYAEGFIAPTLGQLFGTPLQFQATVNDPTNGQTYNILLVNGGNPNLKPQNSYSYYAEMIWTPASKDENSWWKWAKGFSAYVDWYQIELRNEINTLATQTLVGAESAFPGAVIRGANGLISQVNANYLNVGTTLTDGIDFGGSYVTKEYNWGKLDMEVNATYIYNFAPKRLEGNPDGQTASFYVLAADDQFALPDLRLVASIFYSKHVFGNDTFRTGFTWNFSDSEHDFIDNYKGTLPAIDAGLNPPGYVHRVGEWSTVDWQISYQFGPPAEITPETPKPGFDKDGKQVVSDKGIVPLPKGSSKGWRTWLANTTLTFGINNIADTRPPLSTQGGNFFQGYDTEIANPIQRYFYVEVDKKF